MLPMLTADRYCPTDAARIARVKEIRDEFHRCSLLLNGNLAHPERPHPLVSALGRYIGRLHNAYKQPAESNEWMNRTLVEQRAFFTQSPATMYALHSYYSTHMRVGASHIIVYDDNQ